MRVLEYIFSEKSRKNTNNVGFFYNFITLPPTFSTASNADAENA
jgi:hypothetical protein